MSKRAQVQRHLGMLGDIGGIMGAMKNISLMETHKLARFLAYQHRVVASIEAAATDLLSHHPEIGLSVGPAAGAPSPPCPLPHRGRGRMEPASLSGWDHPGLIVAIGSQRGFCGDFNETVAAALHEHWQEAAGKPSSVVVVGRRLAARLGKDPRVLVSLDGPSVVEEVQPVLGRLITALGELQAREGRAGPFAVTVFAHREGEDGLGRRSILPVPQSRSPDEAIAQSGGAGTWISLRSIQATQYPPRLNLSPSALFSELARHYLWAQMHDLFYGSLMAENRRRLQHMEGAMRRMEEKTEALRRRYNLLRQEEITEEIEVIMLSSEASIAHPRRNQQATTGA